MPHIFYLRMYNMVLVIGLCHASFAADGFQIRFAGTMMFVFLPGTVSFYLHRFDNQNIFQGIQRVFTCARG